MVRPKVPLISRSKVAEHSLQIIDAEGLDRLTVSRLAKALGVSHTSLYHHYRSKEDMLDDVVRFALREIEIPTPEVDVLDWLTGNALEYRRMLARHPNVAPLMTRWNFKTDAPVYEHARKGLCAFGITEDDADSILRAAEALILGWSALSAPEIETSHHDQLNEFELCYRTMLDALVDKMSSTDISS